MLELIHISLTLGETLSMKYDTTNVIDIIKALVLIQTIVFIAHAMPYEWPLLYLFSISKNLYETTKALENLDKANKISPQAIKALIIALNYGTV